MFIQWLDDVYYNNFRSNVSCYSWRYGRMKYRLEPCNVFLQKATQINRTRDTLWSIEKVRHLQRTLLSVCWWYHVVSHSFWVSLFLIFLVLESVPRSYIFQLLGHLRKRNGQVNRTKRLFPITITTATATTTTKTTTFITTSNTVTKIWSSVLTGWSY